MRPLYDKVFVRREESDDRTKGGILLPDSAKDKARVGVVVASGPGVAGNGTYIKNEACRGDRVLLAKWAGSEVEIDGDKLLVVRDSDILAIL